MIASMERDEIAEDLKSLVGEEGLIQRLPPRIRWMWTLLDGMLLIALLLGGTIAFFVPSLRTYRLYTTIILFILTLPVVINICLHPFRVRAWLLTIAADELRVREGVIIREEIFLPMNRIQHVDTHQGIFERLFNLTSLRIATAAKVHSVPGLSSDRLNTIRELILNYLKAHPCEL